MGESKALSRIKSVQLLHGLFGHVLALGVLVAVVHAQLSISGIEPDWGSTAGGTR